MNIVDMAAITSNIKAATFTMPAIAPILTASKKSAAS